MAETKDKPLLPAYLIVGEDHLKRDYTLERMRKRLEKLGDLSLNSDRFDGSTAEGSAIVAACETMPFASEKRLVMVVNADKLNKASQQEVIAYIKKPSDTTVLILVADKLAANTALYKTVDALGNKAVIKCPLLKKSELPTLVRERAVAHDISLTPKAVQLLIELVGDDTIHIDEELKKLALASGGKDTVDDKDVRTLVARISEAKPWEFVDAFSARNARECIRLLSIMPSVSPHALLRQCVSRVRELICAQSLMGSAGNPQQALASELGLQDWRVKNHIGWARRFTPHELRNALASSLDCERKMKGGSDPEAAFIDWVLRVTAA